MKKNLLKISITTMCAAFLIFLPNAKAFARNASTSVLPTDVTTPFDSTTTLVGIEGSYLEDADAYLKRLNSIRYDACVSGVPDPRDSTRTLTIDDYVPLKWSGSLQWIARVRAAESTINVDHVRPNGNSCFTLDAPDGTESYAEVLAWGADGITLWYNEKSDWVNNTGGVTGHYTSMINPDNIYVGVAYFSSKTGAWSSSYAGEFSPYETNATTALNPVKNIIQKVEVKKASLGSYTLLTSSRTTPKTIKLSKSRTYDVYAPVTYDGYKSYVSYIGNITYSSTKPKTLSVDNYGKITGQAIGKSYLKAKISGKTIKLKITVKPIFKTVHFTKYLVAYSKLKLKWNKGSKGITGYQIQYSTDRFAHKKTKTKKGRNKNSIKLSGLKSGTLYYIRVRSYKKINGKKYYSSWSDSLLIRVYL